MKWINKGHEFDDLGLKIIKCETLYIRGAGAMGEDFIQELKWLGIADEFEIIFVDNDEKKIGKKHLGYPIISTIEFKSLFVNDGKSVLILALSQKFISDVLIELSENAQIVRKINCFISIWYEFCPPESRKIFLPIYMLYKHNCLYHDLYNQVSTSHCNLKCKKCLNFLPYAREHYQTSLEDMKSDIDAFFSKVDKLHFYVNNGGESLLHPNLVEILDYIKIKYGDRIFSLNIITNGSILPTKQQICCFLKNNIEVKIDDYSIALSNSYSEKLRKTVDLLKKEHVKYWINNVDSWVDLCPREIDNSNMTDIQLTKYYNNCAIPYVDIVNGRMYACAYASFAVRAKLVPDSYCDSISLVNSSKKEIFEFANYYTEKGYIDFCKQCAGYLTINDGRVSVAEQL